MTRIKASNVVRSRPIRVIRAIRGYELPRLFAL
jgi:hypothetical protein